MLVPQSSSFSELLNGLLSRHKLTQMGDTSQLLDALFWHCCQMLQKQAEQKTQCGIWLQPSSVSHQLIPLARELSDSVEVDCLVIISVSDAAEHAKSLLKEGWCDYPLLICQESQFAQLTKLQLLFIQESLFFTTNYWPGQLIKLGLPHGIDIPLKKTLTEYGGCLEFDYVLSARPQANMPTDSFVNRYPQALRIHSRPFVAEIPFGFVKYDDFYRHRKACTAADTTLIYHISNLALEWPWVQHQLQSTISLLLTHFPGYPIVFRSFPADFEHPAVVACRQFFAHESRFKFSDAPSYVDDYSTGAVMIGHRFYNGHLFPLVTGRPQIVYQPESPRDNEAEIISDSATLVARIQTELKHIRSLSPDMLNRADIYNPGCAVRYLLNNLKYILTDSKHPDWHYFSLDCELELDVVLQQAESGPLAFNKLALAAVQLFPDKMDYQLLALESLIRVPVSLHGSELSLLYWRKAMTMAAQMLKRVQQGEDLRALDCWMYQRGLPVFRQMLELMTTFEIEINEHEQRLLVHYKPTEFRHWQEHRQFTVVAVADGSQLTGGEVILYGAGQLAVEFMAEQMLSHKYQVVAIVDSLACKWHQQIAGITIQSPRMLTSTIQPVVICSRAFAEEIRSQLLKLPDLQHRLYRLL